MKDYIAMPHEFFPLCSFTVSIHCIEDFVANFIKKKNLKFIATIQILGSTLKVASAPSLQLGLSQLCSFFDQLCYSIMLHLKKSIMLIKGTNYA